jgi:flagellar assembly protein FliH
MERSQIAGARIIPLREWLENQQEDHTEKREDASSDDTCDAIEVARVQVFETAWKEGFESGMAEAKERIESRAESAERQWKSKYAEEIERMSSASARLKALETPMTGAVEALERRIESLVIEVAFAAVSRIVAAAAKDRRMVIDICREALAEYAIRPVLLMVSRSDLDAVRSVFTDSDIRVESDPRLSAGQCRLESAKGLYDASIEHRLEVLRQSFIDCINDRGADA